MTDHPKDQVSHICTKELRLTVMNNLRDDSEIVYTYWQGCTMEGKPILFSVQRLKEECLSPGNFTACLFTPVTRKPAVTFFSVMDWNQASENRLEKSYTDTTRQGFFMQNLWQTWCHATFRGPKDPLSSGCVRCVVLGGSVKSITCWSAAIRMT